MLKFFKEHPNSVNETYCEHLIFTLRTGSRIVATGFACMLHGLFPFLFTDFASKRIIAMSKNFRKRVDLNSKNLIKKIK